MFCEEKYQREWRKAEKIRKEKSGKGSWDEKNLEIDELEVSKNHNKLIGRELI